MAAVAVGAARLRSVRAIGPTTSSVSPGFMTEQSHDATAQPCNPDLAEMVYGVGKMDYRQTALTFYKEATAAGDKIFVSKGEQATYNDAKLACTNAGGQLASPQNAEENKAVLDFCKMYKVFPYLGINDLLIEGSFRYPNGEMLSYSNWSDKEPNNDQGVEDCVEMYDNGKWNDKNCNEKRLIICEF
ncbi:unnamed protein product [Ranitomeya imitator]|uniref:C-type lectin domain-containing protein n=1 Tax=Ranitomeya imitator TaxID=111125 RepID=A0ABN9L3K6_9NEOB|nr:unnamed protein product [Ranitomeya imitator]